MKFWGGGQSINFPLFKCSTNVHLELIQFLYVWPINPHRNLFPKCTSMPKLLTGFLKQFPVQRFHNKNNVWMSAHFAQWMLNTNSCLMTSKHSPTIYPPFTTLQLMSYSSEFWLENRKSSWPMLKLCRIN